MLERFEKRITSEFREDGVLEHIFKRLPVNKFNKRYYVYLRDESHLLKTRHMLRHMILHFRFVNAICHKTHPNGNVPCTMDGVKSLFKDNALVFNNPIDLLAVECKATDFWLIKTFIEQCKEYGCSLPNVVVVRHNYILGPTRSIAVPYSTTKKSNDMNYSGGSLKAYCNILKDYTFVGCLKYALAGFFIKTSVIQQHGGFSEANIDDVFKYPNVVHGMNKRWPESEKKFWITIK